MSIVKMQRISIYALSRYSKEVLETLQRMGVMEIENVGIEDSVFYQTESSFYCTSFLRSASLMTQAADVICEYTKEKKGLLSSLEGRTPLSVKEYEAIAEKNPEIAEKLTTIFVAPDSIDELRTRLRGRATESEEDIERRMRTAIDEFKQADKFDKKIDSKTKDEDYSALKKIYLEIKQ